MNTSATTVSHRVEVASPIEGVVYPPTDRLQGYLEAGALTRETLADGFRASFAEHADRTALCGSDGDLTYRQLDEVTDRFAAALLALGLRSPDRVVFQLANSNELVIGFVACLKAGLIPVATLAAHREHEIGYLAGLSEARAHFVQGDDAKFDDVAFAQQMQSQIASLKWIVQARGTTRGAAHGMRSMIDEMPLNAARQALANVELDPFQVAVFQLSGGTTGVPKIIPRFNNEYLYNMRAVAQFNGYRADDVLFMPLPMMHNLNMGCCFGPFLLTGGAITVASDLQPASLVSTFQRYLPTWAVLGGPILEKLRPAIESGEMPVKQLRSVVSSTGAPKLRSILGVPAYHIFGMTEGAIMMTRDDQPQVVRDSMVGRPVSPHDEVKLFKIGTEEEILEEGVEGECAFAGPYTIHGYYRAPERNKETFTRGGFYRSGDLMLFRDIDGQRYYKFCGRTKDVVDRGGEKINCEEVESVVSRHPAVAMTSVVGMPDPVFGERVCAFMVVKPGHDAPSVAALGAFLSEVGVAKFKWPERIEVLDEFPLTKTGKLSKPLLKQVIVDKLAAEKTAVAHNHSEARSST
ncbi:AMP-binding protein [Variovorax robiniae]|uniref:AMP-binding protein n=1 Tax=Variovorax robiniae TaxID=1836199 RepID=A0ABU8XJ61_9BURK